MLHAFGMPVTIKVLVRRGTLEVSLCSGILVRSLPFGEFLVITQSLWWLLLWTLVRLFF